MIKEIPMLFSTAMVLAKLEKRKTMTRRLRNLEAINENPDKWSFQEKFTQVGKYERDKHVYRFVDGEGSFRDILCPFGRPGDLLWVRETWRSMGFDGDNNTMLFEFKDGASHWVTMPKDYKLFAQKKWRPSIHMPKVASRIWLQVESVRVERLQDISEADAIAEGVQPNCAGVDKCPSQYCQRMGCQCTGEYYHYQRDLDDFPAYSAKESFESLWQSINGADSWKANPWVWVISFKVLSTTGKPDLQIT